MAVIDMSRYAVSDVPPCRVAVCLAVRQRLSHDRAKYLRPTDNILLAALIAALPLVIVTVSAAFVAGVAVLGPARQSARALLVLDRLVLLIAVLRGGKAGARFIDRMAKALRRLPPR
jgi:hypothetical protein